MSDPTTPTHQVFVSYPHEDEAIADAVVAVLEDRGVRCWQAPRDVPAGAEWAGAIVDAIEASRLLVLVFSSTANDSDHILREVRAAADADVAIVPFRTTAAEPSSALRYYLGGTHWLDASTEPIDAHLEVLTTRVTEILGVGEATDVESVGPPIAGPPPPGSPREPWWRRVPRTAGVAAAVAVLGLAVLVGAILAGGGSDGDPVAVEQDAGDLAESTDDDSPGTPDDPAPTEENAVTDAPGTDGDDSFAGAGAMPAGASDQPFNFAFTVANRDGPNFSCDAGFDIDFGVNCRPVDDVERGEDVAVADFDIDGTLDHASVGPGWEGDGVPVPATSRICLTEDLIDTENYDCADVSADRLDSHAVAAADVNDDGAMDLLAGSFPGEGGDPGDFVLVCLGDSFGRFTCQRSVDLDRDPDQGPLVDDIAVADIDNDGAVDLVLAMFNGPNQLCRGLGGGDFVCEDVEPEIALSTGAAAADLDGDGLADLVFTNQGTPHRRCLGTAGGPFDCADIGEPDLGTMVDIGDLDLDGHLDLLLGRGDLSGGEHDPEMGTTDQACLGDGRGSFACEGIRGTDALTFDVELADLDGDGDLDYMRVGESSAACFGDGTGSFGCTPLPQLRDDRGFVHAYFTAVAIHS